MSKMGDVVIADMNRRAQLEVIELWEILVPTVRRIGGKPYTTRYHRVWDAQVRKITGGLTILPVERGQWVNKGELYNERMIPVRVACTRNQIDEISDFSARYYDQLAMMYYQVSNQIIIKHYDQVSPKS